MAMIVPQVLVLLGMNIFLFIKKYRRIHPSISAIQLSLGRDLTGLGIKFFIIQITWMIIFSTDNIIITELFGPHSVTPYNIAFQYTSIAAFVFSIILAPSWSAFTEAHTLNDKKWITKTIIRLMKIWAILVFGLLVLILISQPFYEIWIGKDLLIPKKLTILMAIFVAQTAFTSIFTHYIE